MTRVYSNVVFLAVVTAIAAGFSFKVIDWIGGAPIILPLGVGLTVGFLQVALVFGKRQVSFTGWLSPFSINAASLFLAAWLVLPVALVLGGMPFRQSIIQAIDPEGIANMMLLAALTPIVASVVTVIMAFASREDVEAE